MKQIQKQLSNKTCINCSATETPQWRKNSEGPLCNKCGVQLYRKGYMMTTCAKPSSVILSLSHPPPLPPLPPPTRKSERITKKYRQATHRRKQKNPRRALFE